MGGLRVLSLVFSHSKEAFMNKIKLIIYEKFSGKLSLEDVMSSAFQSEFIQLMQDRMSGIMKTTEQSQDSFCSGKDVKNGTNEE